MPRFGQIKTNSLTISSNPVIVTANTTLTAKKHGGRIIVFNDADGATMTLPGASGSGTVFEFCVGVTVTSNSDKIQVANSSDTFKGTIWGAADAGNTVNAWEAASTSDTITMDGSTKGGLVGDYFKIIDIKANIWLVQGLIQQTGTEASPFSAAV
jgi:hypothetical protein